MNEFEGFIYYAIRIGWILIGLALISTFFVKVTDVETWRSILLVVFLIDGLYIKITSKISPRKKK